MMRSVEYVGAAAPGVTGVSLGKGKVVLSVVVVVIVAMQKERRRRSVKKERPFLFVETSCALRFLECG